MVVSKRLLTFVFKSNLTTMKNVNLTGLFLALASQFAVKSFEVSCITPNGGEPIDALMYFKEGIVEVNDIPKILAIVKENTGEVKETGVKLTDKGIEIYIEFIGSTFIDELA